MRLDVFLAAGGGASLDADQPVENARRADRALAYQNSRDGLRMAASAGGSVVMHDLAVVRLFADRR